MYLKQECNLLKFYIGKQLEKSAILSLTSFNKSLVNLSEQAH